MRLCHVSDTHGTFPKLLGTFEVVVHSGDFSRNFKRDQDEVSNEMDWVEESIPAIKGWLQGRPLLFTFGNHDFMNPYWFEGLLNSEGIRAVCLHDKITTWEGVNFYGFPYIPPINGRWAYECTADEMAGHFDDMAKAINQTYTDVIVAHAPPGNCLDLSKSNHRWGNSQMNTFLDYQVHKDMDPMYLLCGHVHESHGLMMRNGLLVSNAAVTHHVLEI